MKSVSLVMLNCSVSVSSDKSEFVTERVRSRLPGTGSSSTPPEINHNCREEGGEEGGTHSDIWEIGDCQSHYKWNDTEQINYQGFTRELTS